MLQRIREGSKGWISWLIVGLIALTFIVIGTGGMGGSRQKDVMAKVGDFEITRMQVDNAYDQMVSNPNNRQLLDLDPKVLKNQALDALIQNQTLVNRSHTLGLRVSDRKINQIIVGIPAFQEDGKFSQNRYLNIIYQNRFTDKTFRDSLKEDTMIRQMRNGIVATAFSLPEDVATVVRFIDQKRDFDYMTVESKRFNDSIKLSDDAIKAHYDANLSDYMTDEKIKVEYLSLSLEDAAKDVKVTEEELLGFYEDNIGFYSTPEKVKVAHIMVEFNKLDTASMVKADELIKDIHERLKSGESFEDLAKKHSDDTVSAKDGGTLDWITKGELNNSSFEQAAFALKAVNDFSNPISTQDGMHIVKLIEKKSASIEPYTKVKEEVTEHFKTQKGEHVLAEKADKLITLAYEHPDSLANAAEAIGIEIKQSDFFTREGSKEDALNNSKVLSAAFSEPVLNSQNSEMLEISDDHYVVLRKLEHNAPVQLPLEQVKDKIEATLIQKGSEEKAQALALEIQQQLEKGANPQEVAAKHKISIKKALDVTRVSTDVPTSIIEEAFRLPKPVAANPVVGTVSLSGGNSGIVVLSKVVDGKIDAEIDERVSYFTDSVAENFGLIEYNLFMQQARKLESVERKASF